MGRDVAHSVMSRLPGLSRIEFGTLSFSDVMEQTGTVQNQALLSAHVQATSSTAMRATSVDCRYVLFDLASIAPAKVEQMRSMVSSSARTTCSEGSRAATILFR